MIVIQLSVELQVYFKSVSESYKSILSVIFIHGSLECKFSCVLQQRWKLDPGQGCWPNKADTDNKKPCGDAKDSPTKETMKMSCSLKRIKVDF